MRTYDIFSSENVAKNAMKNTHSNLGKFSDIRIIMFKVSGSTEIYLTLLETALIFPLGNI